VTNTPCSWYGVGCDGGHLTALRLSEQVSGEIPSELGNLSQLEHLRLDKNQLSGEIPSQLGNLSQLEYLYLDSNPLTGEILREGALSFLGTFVYPLVGGDITDKTVVENVGQERGQLMKTEWMR